MIFPLQKATHCWLWSIMILLSSCDSFENKQVTADDVEIFLVRNCSKSAFSSKCDIEDADMGIAFSNNTPYPVELFSEGDCLYPERINHFTVDSKLRIFSYRGGSRTGYGSHATTKVIPGETVCFQIESGQLEHWLKVDDNVDISEFSYLYQRQSRDSVYKLSLIVYIRDGQLAQYSGSLPLVDGAIVKELPPAQ